eukprot:3364121-Amphidinium_carterae.1
MFASSGRRDLQRAGRTVLASHPTCYLVLKKRCPRLPMNSFLLLPNVGRDSRANGKFVFRVLGLIIVTPFLLFICAKAAKAKPVSADDNVAPRCRSWMHVDYRL